MKELRGRLAVVTGAGSGIGRELASQLVEAGASVALCDIFEDSLSESAARCRTLATSGQRVSAHRCDVADEAEVLAFRDAVQHEHPSGALHLLFNNAGIGGGNSFVAGDRARWERTFGVCWFGVYYCTRAFLPLLLAAAQARIVNVSSVSGFFALDPRAGPQSAYSSAKFAVKGFSEALIADLRQHAPHVGVTLVMPGHVASSIVPNTLRTFGLPAPEVDVFRQSAPTTAADAARIILDGVRAGEWRILVGSDAEALDARVRAAPERAYDPDFVQQLFEDGVLRLRG